MHRRLGVIIVVAGLFFVNNGSASADTVDYIVNVAPSLEITLSSNSLVLDLNPNTKTSDSKDLNIKVSTNNYTGYKLTMSSTGDVTDLVRDNTVDGKNATIPTLFAAAGATASTLTDNTWGYKKDSGNFIPYVSGVTLLENPGPTNEDTGTLSFASKINYSQATGSYSIGLDFVGVVNPLLPFLYETVASMSKGTQTAADLQAAITVPTSADRTLDTSNSGVYEYDAAEFGAATDAANTHAIYYYRGVLEDTVGSYGSDGSAVTYPNYVKLGNTCWRILRTTGSGGVKMIYNGLYGATISGSCANSQSSAALPSSSAFDNTAHPDNGHSVVGIGYTYDASYKATTTSVRAGILFGANSGDSNTTDSTIKTNIDSWYTSNLSTYTSHLESSAGYCNDRSVNTGDTWISWNDNTSISAPLATGNNNTTYYFGAYQRNMSTYQNLTLGCPRNTVDLYTTSSAPNGNKRLSNPVALITADEASFSGSGRGHDTQASYHTKSFLNSGSHSYLLSPSWRSGPGAAYGSNLYSNGYIFYSNVTQARSVRPAISLSPGAYITSGTGIATDPWEVSW